MEGADNYSSYQVPAGETAAKAKHGNGNNKVGEGLARTKAAASTGVKKVKAGTSSALHWIKDKCHKPTTSVQNI